MGVEQARGLYLNYLTDGYQEIRKGTDKWGKAEKFHNSYGLAKANSIIPSKPIFVKEHKVLSLLTEKERYDGECDALRWSDRTGFLTYLLVPRVGQRCTASFAILQNASRTLIPSANVTDPEEYEYSVNGTAVYE